MIYTLTTNPAIDMNICTNGLVTKKVNRTYDMVFSPNGKGLNVSFVLKYFGIESTIMGFFGGFSGRYIVDESRSRGFCVVPVWIDDTTRINVFVNDVAGEYKLVNEGPFVTEENQRHLLKDIKQAEDMNCLIISGSIPKNISQDFYDKISLICKEKKIDLIFDISSPKLKELLKYSPLLIKPNEEELKDIFGFDTQNEQDIINAMEKVYNMGAQNILLTLGEKGSYFYNGRDFYYVSTQQIKLLSSACAGDSALAAFLSVWLFHPDNIELALKKSAATGANVAESNAIGNLEKVDEYQDNISVRKVKRNVVSYN